MCIVMYVQEYDIRTYKSMICKLCSYGAMVCTIGYVQEEVMHRGGAVLHQKVSLFNSRILHTWVVDSLDTKQ